MTFNNEVNIALLSATEINLGSTGATAIYVVPTGKRCIISHAVMVVGSSGDSGSQFQIGSSTSSNQDFVTGYAFSGLGSEFDAGYISPVPSATVPEIKSYGAGDTINFEVTSSSGSSGNTLYLFGTLYTA